MENDSLSDTQIEVIELYKRDLKHETIKLLSNSGKLVYSTNADEIGHVNKKEYFNNVVTKGNVLSRYG